MVRYACQVPLLVGAVTTAAINNSGDSCNKCGISIQSSTSVHKTWTKDLPPQHWRPVEEVLIPFSVESFRQTSADVSTGLAGVTSWILHCLYVLSRFGENSEYTFSISSIHARRSMPKSMNAQSMPSFLYSSCSSTNIWWLKNCCSFSLVKLMQSCSKPLYCCVHSRTRVRRVVTQHAEWHRTKRDTRRQREQRTKTREEKNDQYADNKICRSISVTCFVVSFLCNSDGSTVISRSVSVQRIYVISHIVLSSFVSVLKYIQMYLFCSVGQIILTFCITLVTFCNAEVVIFMYSLWIYSVFCFQSLRTLIKSHKFLKPRQS